MYQTPQQVSDANDSARAFFQALNVAFAATLRDSVNRSGLVETLLSQVLDSFDGNIAAQTEHEPALACHKGCATCCTLRVGATAPEVLLIARFLRAVAPGLANRGVDLVGRVREADAVTNGLDEQARVKLRRACPFVVQGVCVIYSVRPLACRGHASHDARACADAAAGRRDDVPVSVGHRMVRALVQNAMQSALRDAGLAWGVYELNRAVLLAMDDPARHDAWLNGEDAFLSAAICDVSADEMARAYDQLRGGSAA